MKQFVTTILVFERMCVTQKQKVMITTISSSSLFAGEYSCLTVDLTFKREFSYYLLTIYVPCCMLVIVSWVSFWLDPNAVPARVSLGVTTLLTMSTQTASINNSLPPVAYTKAIDVWTGVRINIYYVLIILILSLSIFDLLN